VSRTEWEADGGDGSVASGLVVAWDGARALHVRIAPDHGADSAQTPARRALTALLFVENDRGRMALACRRRGVSSAELNLSCEVARSSGGAVLLLRSGERAALELAFELDAAACPDEPKPDEPKPNPPQPDASRTMRAFAVDGVERIGVNRLREASGSAVERLVVGPFLSREAWSERRCDLVFAQTADGLQLSARRQASLDMLRVALVSRTRGWRFLSAEPAHGVEDVTLAADEALLLLGLPGARLSLEGLADPNGAALEPAREFALMRTEDGAVVALPLDEVMRASASTSLARIGGPAGGRGVALAGQRNAAVSRLAFSPYDPNVQAARRAVQDSAVGREGWPSPMDGGNPFEGVGWPSALVEAIDGLPLADQARLVEWTFADPLLGRLLAALRLFPDRDLAPGEADRLRDALVPLSGPDSAELLRARAALLPDAAARRGVAAVANQLGREWLPLSAAEAAMAAIEIAPAESAGGLAPELATAARALIARWEERTDEIGLIASFDPAQDPLRGAERFADVSPLAEAMALPVMARVAGRIDREVADLLGAGREVASIAAGLKGAGRYLAYRHLVALADVVGGLASPAAPDGAAGAEEPRLMRGVLMRMRAALPAGLAAYVALAGAEAAPPVERQLAERWGQP
jgi:hypothetical protein